jgi:thioredoxin 1
MVAELTDVSNIRKGNVLVDFYTTSCGPCKAMSPILEEISKEFANIKVAKVDVTRNPDMSQMFGVMSVPTVIFMKDNKVRHTARGLQNKATLKTMVLQLING